jgi:hypothetical protein
VLGDAGWHIPGKKKYLNKNIFKNTTTKKYYILLVPNKKVVS